MNHIDETDFIRLVKALDRRSITTMIASGSESSPAEIDAQCACIEHADQVQRDLDERMGRFEAKEAYRWVGGIGDGLIYELHCEIGRSR